MLAAVVRFMLAAAVLAFVRDWLSGPHKEDVVPIKVFGKTYKKFSAAAAAAKKRGISKPNAYVATVERKQRPGSRKK